MILNVILLFKFMKVLKGFKMCILLKIFIFIFLFFSKKLKINLNQPIRSVTQKESETFIQSVEEDRKILIQVIKKQKIKIVFFDNMISIIFRQRLFE